jgi:hypothetical protein
MKFILILLAFVGLLWSSPLNLPAGGGSSDDANNSQDLFSVRIAQFELKNSSGDYITVYADENEIYLDTVGSGTSSLAGTLAGIMPPEGNYTGFRMTITSFKRQTKVVIDDTTYYTTAQDINQSDPINFSTDPIDYGVVTTAIPTDERTWESTFGHILSVSQSEDVHIVWVMKRNGIIQYEVDDNNDVNWLGESEIIRSFLPEKPSKLVTINITGDSETLSNTASILLNADGEYLGSHCFRPDNKLMNCSNSVRGTITGPVGENNATAFELVFRDGDQTGDYLVKGMYNCDKSAYNQLYIETNSSNPLNGTPDISGSVSCTNIQY